MKGVTFMPRDYETEIERLRGLQNQKSKLEGGISACDSVIRLIQAKPTKDGLTVGRPRIDIEVSDDYSDGDYWASAKIRFERDKLSQNIIDAIIRLAEDRKNELTVELNNMP